MCFQSFGLSAHPSCCMLPWLSLYPMAASMIQCYWEHSVDCLIDISNYYTSRNMNLTSDDEHNLSLLSMHEKYKLPLPWPHKKKKKKRGSKSFMWPVLLFLYGKPQASKPAKHLPLRTTSTVVYQKCRVASKIEREPSPQSMIVSHQCVRLASKAMSPFPLHTSFQVKTWMFSMVI